MPFAAFVRQLKRPSRSAHITLGKHMKIRYAPLAAACALMVAAAATTTAQASAVTYYFGGKLEGVDTGLPSLSVGNSFSGSFTFESTAVDAFSNPSIGVYNTGSAVEVTVNGFAYASTSLCSLCTGVQVTNDLVGNSFYAYSGGTGSLVGQSLGGLSPYLVFISLDGHSQTVFSNDALPSSLSLSSFDNSYFSIEFGDRALGSSSTAGGPLTYLSTTAPVPVPEASTSAMLALGLGALAVVRRRKDR